jgi:hypothetical protein
LERKRNFGSLELNKGGYELDMVGYVDLGNWKTLYGLKIDGGETGKHFQAQETPQKR